MAFCECPGPNSKRNSHLSDSDKSMFSLGIGIWVACSLLELVFGPLAVSSCRHNCLILVIHTGREDPNCLDLGILT